jgi:hypothetical protein
MKYKICFAATSSFLFILFLTYWIHITFFKIDVIFYAALVDGLIATIITFVIFLSSKKFRACTSIEKLLLAIVWVLTGYIFAISVPTVLDRSLSFYTLEKLQQRGGGIKYSAFEGIYANEYIKEHRLADVRLTEQLSSGTIVIENDCVKLTKLGDRLASFSRFFRANLLPKRRLLMNKYTDELVDPFRASELTASYVCY